MFASDSSLSSTKGNSAGGEIRRGTGVDNCDVNKKKITTEGNSEVGSSVVTGPQAGGFDVHRPADSLDPELESPLQSVVSRDFGGMTAGEVMPRIAREGGMATETSGGVSEAGGQPRRRRTLARRPRWKGECRKK
jgi:hypothetical protein